MNKDFENHLKNLRERFPHECWEGIDPDTAGIGKNFLLAKIIYEMIRFEREK